MRGRDGESDDFRDDYEFQDEEGPEARFNREEAAAEHRRQQADERIIHALLASLSGYDAARICFSWADIQRFRLRRRT